MAGKMSKEEIDNALAKGNNLSYIYETQTLTETQLNKAIDNRKELYCLYKNNKLFVSNLDKAIFEYGDIHDKCYGYLLSSQPNLSDKHIHEALESSQLIACSCLKEQELNDRNIDKCLDLISDNKYKDAAIMKKMIYTNQKLTPKHIDKVMDNDLSPHWVYEYQQLTCEQIDNALDRGRALWCLYIYQDLTKQQIDRAIKKGEHLRGLKKHQELTNKQTTILEL